MARKLRGTLLSTTADWLRDCFTATWPHACNAAAAYGRADVPGVAAEVALATRLAGGSSSTVDALARLHARLAAEKIGVYAPPPLRREGALHDLRVHRDVSAGDAYAPTLSLVSPAAQQAEAGSSAEGESGESGKTGPQVVTKPELSVEVLDEGEISISPAEQRAARGLELLSYARERARVMAVGANLDIQEAVDVATAAVVAGLINFDGPEAVIVAPIGSSGESISAAYAAAKEVCKGGKVEGSDLDRMICAAMVAAESAGAGAPLKLAIKAGRSAAASMKDGKSMDEVRKG